MTSEIQHKYYDEHTIYVDSGAISKANLDVILKDAILPLKESMKKVGQTLNIQRELKLVINKEGMSLGRAYLWVADPQLYHILNGKNPNGSERIEEYDNPDYKPLNETSAVDMSIPEGVPWGDLSDDEDVEPKIKVKLPSLVQFNTYIYNENERVLAENIINIELKNKVLNEFYEKVVIPGHTQDWKTSASEFSKLVENIKTEYNVVESIILRAISNVLSVELKIDPRELDPNQIQLDEDFIDQVTEILGNFEVPPIPSSHTISISGAYVLNVEDDQIRHVLTARIYPVIVSPDQQKIIKENKLSKNREGKFEMFIVPEEKTLIEKFLPYTTIKEYPNKDKKMIKYPMYNYNQKTRVVSISFFDRSGRDAQFALLMNKKLEYIDPKTKLPLTLLFQLGKNFSAKY